MSARRRLREPWGLVALLVGGASWDALGYLGHVDLFLPRHVGVQLAIQGFALVFLIATGSWPFATNHREDAG